MNEKKNYQGPTTGKGVNWENYSHNFHSNWRRQETEKNKQKKKKKTACNKDYEGKYSDLTEKFLEAHIKQGSQERPRWEFDPKNKIETIT